MLRFTGISAEFVGMRSHHKRSGWERDHLRTLRAVAPLCPALDRGDHVTRLSHVPTVSIPRNIGLHRCHSVEPLGPEPPLVIFGGAPSGDILRPRLLCAAFLLGPSRCRLLLAALDVRDPNARFGGAQA